MRSLTTGLCLLLFSSLMLLPAQAQDITQGDPGYLDLHNLDAWFETPPTLEVNIEGPLLRMLLRASKTSEPELADTFDQLRAIQVRAYEQATADASERIASLGDELRQRGWETVVRIREADETVNVLMHASESLISGIAVMIVRPGDESLFVNVSGDIEPEQLGRLGEALNIGALERLGMNHLPES